MGTLTEVLSFDSPNLFVNASIINLPRSVGIQTKVAGWGFGVGDYTAAGRVGATACEATVWVSDEEVACLSLFLSLLPPLSPSLPPSLLLPLSRSLLLSLSLSISHSLSLTPTVTLTLTLTISDFARCHAPSRRGCPGRAGRLSRSARPSGA